MGANRRQEIFDAVAKHLFDQGCRCVRYSRKLDQEVCVYRGPEGRKCAAGALIPDGVYTKKMEGKSISTVFYLNHAMRELYPQSCRDLIAQLQMLHDKRANWESEETLRSALASLGERQGLGTAFLSALHFNSSGE